MSFSEKLRDLRKQKGISQREIAVHLNISIMAYSYYERGQREPSIDMLKNICLFFDVSADYLIGLTDEY